MPTTSIAYDLEGSPAISATGIVFVKSSTQSLYAFNVSNGAQLWKTTTGLALYSSPVIGADNTVYLPVENSTVLAINGTTGSIR